MSEIEHSRVLEIVEKLELKDNDTEVAMSLIAHEVQADDHAVQEDRLTTLEGLAAGKNKQMWVVWTLCILAGLVFVGSFMNHVNTDVFNQLDGGVSEETEKKLLENRKVYTEQERLILYGDENYSNREERSYHLWQSDIGNAQYYIEYCIIVYGQTNSFPHDMVEVGERIDPENAWYLLMKAHEIIVQDYGDYSKRGSIDGDRLVEIIKPKVKSVELNPLACELTRWRINDAEKFEVVITLIKQSFEKKVLTDYQIELTEKRLAIITEGAEYDMLSSLEPIVATYGMMGSGMRYMSVGSVVEAYLVQLSERATPADAEEVRAWMNGYLAHLRKMSESPMLIDGLVTLQGLRSSMSAMLIAAEKAGLKEEAAKISATIAQLNAEKIVMEAPKEHNQEMKTKASIFAWMSSGFSNNKTVKPVGYDMEKFKPTRIAEQALVGRIFSHSLIKLFGVIVAVLLIFRMTRPKLVYKLGVKTLARLSFMDWSMILGLGVVIPVVYYAWVVSSTGWSAREYAFTWPKPGYIFGYQFLGMLLLVITMSRNILRFLLFKRSNRLIAKPRLWSWCASLLAFILIPFSYYLSTGSLVVSLVCGLVLLYLLIWQLVGLWKMLFRVESRFGKAGLGLGSCAILSLLIICLQVLAMFHHKEEIHWVGKDEYFIATKGEALPTIHERNVAKQLQKENKERLDRLD
mgnify:CR=1 FL=1